ncbi:hypothetical protein KASHIRA_02080 [Serratia phage vB_SmaM-Kashira]|nr:hypothetical protein KASHIRA_02080 [Serratia phage vB_SmaM-Kashira]
MNCLITVAAAIFLMLVAVPVAYIAAGIGIMTTGAADAVAVCGAVALFVAGPLAGLAMVMDAMIPKVRGRYL